MEREILIEQWIAGTLNPAGRQELSALLETEEGVEWLAGYMDEQMREANDYAQVFAPQARLLQERILRTVEEETVIASKPVTTIKRIWLRYAAAAVFIFAIAMVYFLMSKKENPGLAITADIQAPASNRATVHMADGHMVYLDSAKNGQLASSGNMKLIKLGDGRVAYKGSAEKIEYNTITNPRGSRVIDIELTDGSHVWLNAGSSMTYPVPMTGKTRDVTVKGEAYFEIAKDVKHPFTVTNGETKVTVLGTHFNVKAYEDEKDTRVTLLEGSVKVASGLATQMIKPGEQAIVKNAIHVSTEIDLDEVLAWKNGKFLFGEKADIRDIMRQVSRWYDVDVEFRGAIAQHFGGGISRNVNISQVLKVLESTGNVTCIIEGKKVIVMP
jgi:transmembrane sensor